MKEFYEMVGWMVTEKWIAITISILFIGLIFFTLWLIVLFLYKFFEKKYLNNDCCGDLSRHSFFDTINTLISTEIQWLKFYHHWKFSKNRTMMMRDLLMIKMVIRKDTMEKIMAEPNLTFEIFTKHIQNLLNECDMKWEKSGIPDLVREKFAEWHWPNARTLLRCASDIFQSNLFEWTDAIKKWLLNINAATLVHTQLDAEKTLGDLNWELSWVHYKNKILE